jgi:excisionase family DNA binding protein
MDKVPKLVQDSVAQILKPYGVDFDSLMSGNTAYITPREAAEICGLSPKTIRNKALTGEIRAKRLGDHRRSRVLIDKNHLCQWLGKMPSATTTPKTGEEQK